MRAAVLGSPIAHSLSPVLHRAAYAELGLDWTYEAVEVTPAHLADFLANLDASWVGLSLTMPLKETVLPYLTDASELVLDTRSANTIVFEGQQLHGYNTDVHGICWSLGRVGVTELRTSTAAVLGAGATARSAIAALGSLGVRQIAVVARRREAADDMSQVAATVGVELEWVPWERGDQTLCSDVVISTVPRDVADVFTNAIPDRPGTLLDVVYSPWPTALARGWVDQGGTVIGGLEMLVGQAAEQVRLMTGFEAPVEKMLAAGSAAL